MSRSKKSLKNILYAFTGQFFGLIISFFSRIVFINILGSEYLGLNGLFSNILMVLALAELGVGEAITYSLYKPLAEKNEKKCISLMQLYKRFYTFIGIIILVLGLCILPFLPYFINDIPEISNINYIYILFLINTSISYFFSYKRNLIIADQRRYIATFYRYLFYFILNISQIIFLIITHNYILFLIIQIICTLLENIFVSFKANRLYPFLLKKDKVLLDEESKKSIIKNIRAMMMHKVGSVIVNSTDNIILSKYVGLNAVGLYSNYYLITNSLNVIFSQLYNSIRASVGNLCVDDDKEKQYKVFEKIYFISFWLYSFSSICLICLLNDFIKIWIGKEYILNFSIVLIIVLNFYVYGMRKVTLVFKEAYGLFYNDRWKPVFEAVINLISSIILANYLGILGVFLGTLISSISVCLWVEPYVLFKYGFKKKVYMYFKDYIKYSFIFLTSGFFTYFICSYIDGNLYIIFLIKIVLCLTIPNLIVFLLFHKNEYYIYYIDLMKSIIKKIIKRNVKV